MDFPVTAEFVSTANPGQLHDEARGVNVEWPASFVQTGDGWVYRVDRDDVDAAAVQAALDGHSPTPLVDPQAEFDAALADAATKATVEEKVDALLAALQGDGLPSKAAARGKHGL